MFSLPVNRCTENSSGEQAFGSPQLEDVTPTGTGTAAAAAAASDAFGLTR